MGALQRNLLWWTKVFAKLSNFIKRNLNFISIGVLQVTLRARLYLI